MHLSIPTHKWNSSDLHLPPWRQESEATTENQIESYGESHLPPWRQGSDETTENPENPIGSYEGTGRWPIWYTHNSGYLPIGAYGDSKWEQA